MPAPNFLALDILTPFPVSNPNRDDLNRPKSSIIGGESRQRISSQCIKSAIRHSEVMGGAGILGLKPREVALSLAHDGEHADRTALSMRTRILNEIIREGLLIRGVSAERAEKMGNCISLALRGKDQVAKPKSQKKGQNAEKPADGAEEELDEEEMKPVLEFFSLHEMHICTEYAFGRCEDAEFVKYVEKGNKTAGNAFQKTVCKDVADGRLLNENTISVDVALSGRLFAGNKNLSVVGALSVGHSIAVNPMEVPDEDYWTGVDDLDTEKGGAGMLGVAQLFSSVYYTPVVVDVRKLVSNLGGNEQLAMETVSALIEAFCTVGPSGKRTSTCSYVCAAWAQVRKTSRPFTLASAFIAPLRESDMLAEAIRRAEEATASWERVYGETDKLRLNVLGGDVTLADLQAFAGNWG